MLTARLPMSVALALALGGLLGGVLPSAAAAKKMYFFNKRQGWLVRPAKLDFCSSGCEYDGLKWTNWNADVTVGKGYYAPVTSGEVEGRYPVRITLSNPKRCPNGRTIYTLYKETIAEEPPNGYPRRSKTRWRCNGYTG
jgi:hypothetical protein